MSGYPARSTAERFAEKWMPEPTTGCHLWLAGASPQGYGKMSVGTRRRGDWRMDLAHRIAWELERGPIPAGLCVLHRCDTPACVNPDHLFLGTRPENTADMVAKGRHASPALKRFCANGHEYVGDNILEQSNGHRRCRECQRSQFRRWYDRNRSRQ